MGKHLDRARENATIYSKSCPYCKAPPWSLCVTVLGTPTAYAHTGRVRQVFPHGRQNGDTMKFELYKDNAGEHRWRVVGANGRIIGASSEGFSSQAACGGNALLLHAALAEWVEKDVGVEIVDDG